MLKDLKLTTDLLDYIYAHSQPLNSVQKEILEHNKNLGNLQRMQISEIQGHFLQLIIKISNSKKCLEIGTFTGFSSLTMALALPKEGKIVTLDHDDEIVKIAKSFFKKSKLEKTIKPIVGPALDSLKKMLKNKEIFDLIFIDADKANYINYFDTSLELLKKGGIILADNVFWHGKRVEKFILPLGDGLTICKKV